VPFEGVLAPLRDPAFFQQVRVDAEAGTICWPNGVDLDPDVLYSEATGTPLSELMRLASDGRDEHPATENAPRQPAPGTGDTVPEIGRFFGIVIRMYFDEHMPPHFHATYGAESASVAIETLAVLGGVLPGRVLGLVVEWAALHRAELFENWERARRHEPLLRITPLV
jgi:hypothetical protein